MQQISIFPAGLEKSGILACQNLRIDRRSLRPVGAPAVVAPPGHKPLLHLHLPGGPAVLTAVGSRLHIAATGSAPRHIATLPTPPLCAVASDGSLIVMTEAGPLTFTLPDFLPAATGGFPALRLEAEPAGMVVAAVAPRTLSSDYRTSSAITRSDAQAVASDLMQARAILAAEAIAKAVFIQPVLARYELLDADSRVLHASPAVLLGSSALGAPPSLSLDAAGRLEGYSLEAAAWRPRLIVAADALPPAVAAVRVSLTPQFQSVDVADSAAVSITLRHTPSATLLTPSLRSTEFYLHSGNPSGSAAIVRAIAARFSLLPLAEAVMPLDSAALPLPVPLAPVMDLSGELAAMRAAMRRSVAVASTADARFASPGAFVARCAAVAGETVLWGGVSALRPAPFPLPVFAASVESEPWQAFVEARFSDGSASVWTGGASAAAPVALLPLLSCPSPDAVSLRIGMKTGSRPPVEAVFPLAPSADGLSAAFLHPSCAPFVPEWTVVPEFAPPQPQGAPEAFEGTLLAARMAAPLVAEARAVLPKAVHTLLPAAATAGAWDFGRTRFVAFGHGGIDSVALSADRRSLATGHIDSRRIESPQAVAPGADGSVFAIAGADLVRLRGRATATLCPRCLCTALTRDPVRNELWLFGPDPHAEVVCLASRPCHRYVRPYSMPQAILSAYSGSYALYPEGLLALHAEQPAEAAVVRWSVAVDAPAADRMRISGATFHMAGTCADLSLSVACAGMLSPEPAPSRTLRVAGELRHAFPMRVVARPARSLHISVAGSVSSDFVLNKITLQP